MDHAPSHPPSHTRRAKGIGAAIVSLVGLTGLVGVLPPARSQTPPSTDIYLATVENVVTVELVDGRPTLGELVRVTNRDAYDNQPAFLHDGTIVYSSLGDGGHTEILRLDPVSRRATTVVSTPQGEYSPTPVPDGTAVSVVRAYSPGDQQLWSFPLDAHGAEPALLLHDVNPVGYHAWIDARRLLLFVLGEPATLQVATVGAGPGRVIAENPGRCLARIPAASAQSPLEMSFVRKVAEGEWWLEALDPETGATRRLVQTLPGSEDYAWSPDGSVWASDGSRLFRWRPDDETWSEVADLTERGLRGITRLAFDDDGDRLALVAEH
jgi:hypothetical protein